MADRDQRLVGAWTRHDAPPCAAGYAALLRFEAGGLYFGSSDPPGAFTWWDGGTWNNVTPARLALSVANDAVVSYAYALEGETLAFTDAEGCVFTYRRDR